MVLPTSQEAEAWFVETARAAVAAGQRLDADAVTLLMALAPGDPLLHDAIEAVNASADPDTIAAKARDAALQLRDAFARRDAVLAGTTVTALEMEVLRQYKPGRGLGRFEDDVAVALAMLAAYDVGADETHLMMAEELMLGVIRREWPRRMHTQLRLEDVLSNCEAAVAFAALASRTEKAEYREHAYEVLRGYSASYRELGTRAAPYVSALRMIS